MGRLTRETNSMNPNELRMKLDSMIEIARNTPHYTPNQEWLNQWKKIKDMNPADSAIKDRMILCSNIAGRHE